MRRFTAYNALFQLYQVFKWFSVSLHFLTTQQFRNCLVITNKFQTENLQLFFTSLEPHQEYIIFFSSPGTKKKSTKILFAFVAKYFLSAQRSRHKILDTVVESKEYSWKRAERECVSAFVDVASLTEC